VDVSSGALEVICFSNFSDGLGCMHLGYAAGGGAYGRGGG
jgi:hypothetical protein